MAALLTGDLHVFANAVRCIRGAATLVALFALAQCARSTALVSSGFAGVRPRPAPTVVRVSNNAAPVVANCEDQRP